MGEKFSVLISLYKNEKPEYLREALDSVLNQTLLPNEIVIVEDGPLTKELNSVLQEYTEKNSLIRLIPFAKNRGLGLALRDGILECKNEWIARMDTDDICKPERFEKQLAYLENHKDIVLLGTAIEEFSIDKNRPDSKLFLPKDNTEILHFAKMRNPFKHPSVMLKKTAVITSGNYRHFLWFEDYDLFTRMLKHGFKAANLSDILISVRANKNQFARRGGLKYAKQDIKFQKFLYSIGFINYYEFIRNMLMRCIVRIIPNEMRTFLYQKFLRK